MKARKNSGAARLGIQFTDNPDARDYCERDERAYQEILEHPGAYLIDSLSGDYKSKGDMQ